MHFLLCVNRCQVFHDQTRSIVGKTTLLYWALNPFESFSEPVKSGERGEVAGGKYEVLGKKFEVFGGKFEGGGGKSVTCREKRRRCRWKSVARIKGCVSCRSLFPSMPRHNLCKAVPLAKALCKKHNIPYICKPLMQGFTDIIKWVASRSKPHARSGTHLMTSRASMIKSRRDKILRVVLRPSCV